MTTSHIQDTDVFADNHSAITFDAADETWIVTAGVLVSAAGDDAVFGELGFQSLVNSGSILSAGASGAGVEMLGDNSFISNTAGAWIVGARFGVIVDGAAAGIVNQGSILGLTRIGVEFNNQSGNVTLTNSGSIFGRSAGVGNFSSFGQEVIHNAGLISSVGTAIDIFTADGLTTIISNAAGATIRGAVAAISAAHGRIVLTNHGSIVGEIFSNDEVAAADVIVNRGSIRGNVLLGAGNDLYDGRGGRAGVVLAGAGNDQLSGGKAMDFLSGDAGNDRLAGGGGNDALISGLGLDTLIGGPGSDVFIFHEAPGRALNVGRIIDFTVHVDRVGLNPEVFVGIGTHGALAEAHFHAGAAAADASDRIIYNPNNGFLFYDADGKGGTGQVHFATLAPHLALHGSDFLILTGL